VFGSFVTTAEWPNDVDIVFLMEDSFDLGAVTGEAVLVFHHLEAESTLEQVCFGPDDALQSEGSRRC
jgi:hypothetical protein